MNSNLNPRMPMDLIVGVGLVKKNIGKNIIRKIKRSMLTNSENTLREIERSGK